MQRVCRKCGVEKDFGGFKKAQSCLYGISWTCKSCHAKSASLWQKHNPINAKQGWLKYRKGDKGKQVTKRAIDKYRFSAHGIAKRKEWRDSVLGKSAIRKNSAKRLAQELLALPKWLTEDDMFLIREIYELAALRSRITGIVWEVDHIIPLRGKTVCGLHVPQNLQVITRTENRKKNNKLVVI
jgi:hypothetical protein